MSTDPQTDIETRRRRLRYRAWHRGTKEMDLVLGQFADARLSGADSAFLDRLEKLMDEEDTDLLAWITGQQTVPAHIDGELLSILRAHQQQAAQQQ